MTKGISLGEGVFGIIAYIPNKGLVDYKDLTKEEIKELIKL